MGNATPTAVGSSEAGHRNICMVCVGDALRQRTLILTREALDKHQFDFGTCQEGVDVPVPAPTFAGRHAAVPGSSRRYAIAGAPDI
jgi:hypothetical protein